MTLGEKIRTIRLSKGLTQRALCDNKITRNMLSAIECNKATPSLNTVAYLAKRLSVPLSYILSEDDSLFTYEKQQLLEKIKQSFKEKRYQDCITLIDRINGIDDELALMMAYSYFEIGKKSVLSGSLLSAKSQLELSLKYCDETIYDTEKIGHTAPLYFALAKNIQSPLLELETQKLEIYLVTDFDYELYKYITLDASYQYENKMYSNHIYAKDMMKKRDYYKAIEVLKSIENEKSASTYNAYAFFAIYSDMEMCYKQIGDFEKAYRYSNKRMSMIEGFKT